MVFLHIIVIRYRISNNESYPVSYTFASNRNIKSLCQVWDKFQEVHFLKWSELMWWSSTTLKYNIEYNSWVYAAMIPVVKWSVLVSSIFKYSFFVRLLSKNRDPAILFTNIPDQTLTQGVEMLYHTTFLAWHSNLFNYSIRLQGQVGSLSILQRQTISHNISFVIVIFDTKWNFTVTTYKLMIVIINVSINWTKQYTLA